jgi:hypothetical protein
MISLYINGTNVTQSHQDDSLSEVKLIIHNQFPGVELVSPVCPGDGATCYLSPDQRVDVGSTMQAGFAIGLPQSKSIGALMYKLQRKNTDQSNEGHTSGTSKVTCIQLVMIWKINGSKEFRVVLRLIEHDKGRVWDRDKLMKLVMKKKLFDIQHRPIGGMVDA